MPSTIQNSLNRCSLNDSVFWVQSKFWQSKRPSSPIGIVQTSLQSKRRKSKCEQSIERVQSKQKWTETMVRLGSDKSNNQIMMPHKFCILNSNLLIKRLLKSSDYFLVEAVQITVCQLHVKHEFLLSRNLMFCERLNLALNLRVYRWIITT